MHSCFALSLSFLRPKVTKTCKRRKYYGMQWEEKEKRGNLGRGSIVLLSWTKWWERERKLRNNSWSLVKVHWKRTLAKFLARSNVFKVCLNLESWLWVKQLFIDHLFSQSQRLRLRLRQARSRPKGRWANADDAFPLLLLLPLLRFPLFPFRLLHCAMFDVKRMSIGPFKPFKSAQEDERVEKKWKADKSKKFTQIKCQRCEVEKRKRLQNTEVDTGRSILSITSTYTCTHPWTPLEWTTRINL